MSHPNALLLPPLSLYIHLPWCVKKCPYCDFNSHQADRFEDAGKLPEEAYLVQLLADLEQDLAFAYGRKIHSIFIGGGTPSLMSARFFHELLDKIRNKIAFVDDIEITMEANPGTFEQDKFREFRQTGINRLSIGIQSFQPHLLNALGRIHGREEAITAVEKSRLAGFDNINIDLMHGLPDQSIEQAMEDLNMAIDLNPEHLSWYQLTIEPNTEFYRRPPELPQDTTLWDIQDAGQARLKTNGYAQYEISANAKKGKQAKHNLNYWRFGDYIGIGAGAHGKLTLIDGQIFRTRKTRHPNHYLGNLAQALSIKEEIAKDDLAFEFMMNRLRLFESFELSDYYKFCYHSPSETFMDSCKLAIDKGLLCAPSWKKNTIKTTEKGQLFLNDLLELFLPG
ncbi:radical SAM family heme chaperone HemW [Marinomonas algicola]|uniref:radical SAM family heme chaperone HemW n=1 Tax=Marinomonas algicola TaxID=2773454 RepID=UPI0017495A19|nr:radical SAM family heme chaperone HemW [Marinomonas algicola]